MPDFTARHYNTIASTIANCAQERYEDSRGKSNDYSRGSAETIGAIIRHMGEVFAKDNKRFDYAQFLEAAQGSFEVETRRV